jgi:hypothetical protein
MKSIFLSFITIVSIFLISCSTDVDNYADYEDITIVYGLLEPESDTTWIKITKAFLGPGNALLIAQNPDSSNYADKLDARLIKKKGTNEEIIQLDTLTINHKRPGDSIFYYPNQLMYYTASPIDPAAAYTLEIFRGNELVTSTTPIVQSYPVIFPTNRINFHLTAGGQIRWNSGKNGKRYEVNIVFHYRELHPGNPDTLDKTMNWRLGSRKSMRLEGGEDMDIQYIGEDFYKRLGQQLDDVLNVKRWAGPVDVVIATAADDLNTYLEVNAPSNSIVQEVPEYTNISNGVGIFSSRFTKVQRYQLAVGSEIKLVEDFDWGFIVNR